MYFYMYLVKSGFFGNLIQTLKLYLPIVDTIAHNNNLLLMKIPAYVLK